jgi:RND family efflux transporter MFP subunit
MTKRKILMAAIAVVGSAVALYWMQGGFHSKISGGKTPLQENRAGKIETVEAKAGRTAGTVTVSGTVVSRETARVASRVQGNIVQILVQAGDEVRKGQLLLVLDSREMKERVLQARAALDSARADLTTAERDYNRYESLLEKESISQKTFDEAKAGYEMARASQERAQSALDEAKTFQSYTKVTAPFDGIVSRREVNVGDQASPGRPLLTVIVPKDLELVASAGEQYARYLKEGTPVTVEIPSLNVSKRSSLREVVPQSDEKTRSITVKALLPDLPGLRPGLYGTLAFVTQPTENVTIPFAALRVVGQLESVKVLEKGKVKIRHVKTGRKIGDNVEILSGLNPGEKVVLKD